MSSNDHEFGSALGSVDQIVRVIDLLIIIWIDDEIQFLSDRVHPSPVTNHLKDLKVVYGRIRGDVRLIVSSAFEDHPLNLLPSPSTFLPFGE